MTAALLAGVVATSVVGSVHCLAMCGPLVGLAGGGRLMLVHALGRLATYVALGAAAGAVGSAIDLAGRVGDVQRVATIVAGAFIVTLAIAPFLFRHLRGLGKVTKEKGSHPKGANLLGVADTQRERLSPFGRALVQIKTRRPARRAWLMGAITGLIPCGWLWAFVATAGGTGGVVSGALVMAAFWLGTVPAMVGLLAFAGPVIARLRARMPVVTAAALIALGVGTLALRWRDAGAAQVAAPHCHHCHGAQS